MRSVAEITAQLIASAKQRARKKGGKFELGNEWVSKRIRDGYCELTGLPFSFYPGSPYAPSLDRIDSDNPDYTPDNVRVVCTMINTMRNRWTDHDILIGCRALVEAIERSIGRV